MTEMSNALARERGSATRASRALCLLGFALVGGVLHCSDSEGGVAASAGTGGSSSEVGSGVGGTGESGSAGTGSAGAESVEGGGFTEGGPGNGGAPALDTAGASGASAAGTGGSDEVGPAGAGGVAGAGEAGAAGSPDGGAAGAGDAGAAGAGDAGAAGATGVPPTNQIPEGVGTPCSVDADCPTAAAGTGLMTCLPASSDVAFGFGSPQAGYCSVPCQVQADCDRIDNLSACISLPGGGFCVALCELGLDGVKCGADRAQACFQTSLEVSDVGLCLPMCTSDAACGAQRFCDTSSGLCVGQAPVGGGIGDECAVETAAQDCASGICLTFEAPEGGVVGAFCSANCTLFGNIGCGTDAVSSGPREAACVQPRFVGGGAGDLGFCFELCDADADCAQQDWVCELFGNVETEQALGRLGQCLPPELASAPASP